MQAHLHDNISEELLWQLS